MEVVKHKAGEEGGTVGSGERGGEGEVFTVEALPHQWGNEKVIIRLYVLPVTDVLQSAESSSALPSVGMEEQRNDRKISTLTKQPAPSK